MIVTFHILTDDNTMNRYPVIDLYSKIENLINLIPDGMVTSYGSIASALGDSVATMAVANYVNNNNNFKKKVKSKSEINKINKDKIFKEIPYDGILKKLANFQKNFKKKIALNDGDDKTKYVMALDSSYQIDKNVEYQITASVFMDLNEKKVLSTSISVVEVKFPYIKTYLAFRELPGMLSLLSVVPENTVLLVDGNGILHPRYTGLATMLSILADVPAIGVAKSFLSGTVKDDRIYMFSVEVGRIIKLVNKIYYVSPGNRISIEKSVKIIKKFVDGNNILPLKLADNRSKIWKKALFK